MIQKLFGKHAAAVSVAVVFLVGGATAVGWIDNATANIILTLAGLHAGISASPVAK